MRHNQLKWMTVLACLLAWLPLNTRAQQSDDLQEYLDQLPATDYFGHGADTDLHGAATDNFGHGIDTDLHGVARSGAGFHGVRRSQGVTIPVDLPTVDLSLFSSAKNRTKPLVVSSSVQFVNGSISAASAFAGGGCLLEVRGGATVVLDGTATVDGILCTNADACKAAVGIYGGSTFCQCGYVYAPGSGVAVYIDDAASTYRYLPGKTIGSTDNSGHGTVEEQDAPAVLPAVSTCDWTIGPGGDFPDIKTAMDDSRVEDGQTLEVLDGTTVNDEQVINKSVAIFGPGYAKVNGTRPCQFANISIEASGVTLARVAVSDLYVRDDDITIERCYISHYIESDENYWPANVTLRGCLINGQIYMVWNDNLTIQNSIIFTHETQIAYALFDHNIIYFDGAFGMFEPSESTITNNILFWEHNNSAEFSYGGDEPTCHNNVISLSELSSYFPDNSYGSTLSQVFVATGSMYDEAYWQLSDTSPARGYATDGGDCGPWAGEFPYWIDGVEEAEPTNPLSGDLILNPNIIDNPEAKMYNSLLSLFTDISDNGISGNINVAVEPAAYSFDVNDKTLRVLKRLGAMLAASTATMYMTSEATSSSTFDPNDQPRELIPAASFANCQNNYIPVGFVVDFDGEIRVGGSYGSGSRVYTFANGGDFTKGLYFRQGNVTYGTVNGYKLALEAGKYYDIHFNAARWKETGTIMGFEILDEAENVVVSKTLTPNPNVNGSTAAILGTTSFDYRFVPATDGNYIIKWIADGFNELLLGNPQMKYMPKLEATFNFNMDATFMQQHAADLEDIRLEMEGVLSRLKLKNIKVYINGNPVIFDEFEMEPNDLLALKNMYNQWDGKNWTGKRWSFESNGRRRSDFPGVTFSEDGRVTAIDLEGNGLKGELFRVSSPQLAMLTRLNLRNNQLTGDIGLLVGDLSRLATLNLQYNQLWGLSATLPAACKSVYLEYQNRNINDNSHLTENFYNLPSLVVPVCLKATLPLTLPSLFTYYSPTRRGLYADGGSSVIGWLNDDSSRRLSLTFNNYHVYRYEQDKKLAMILEEGIARHSAYPVMMRYAEGDADLSGYTNIYDVQWTLNYILAPAKVTDFNYSAANTYSDNNINVQDIVATVNIILSNATDNSDSRAVVGNAVVGNASERCVVEDSSDCHAWKRDPLVGNASERYEVVGTVYTQNSYVMLSSEKPVSAIDITLDGISTAEVSLMLNQRDFQMIGRDTDSGSRYVIFSPSGKALPTDRAVSILRMSRPGLPSAIQCSDPDAQEVCIAIDGQATGIATVHDDQLSNLNSQSSTLYDLQGRRIDNVQLRKGIYIRNGKIVINE